MEDILSAVKKRNQRTAELVEIFNAYEKLWNKSFYLDKKREECQHLVAMLEHDVANFLRKLPSSSAEPSPLSFSSQVEKYKEFFQSILDNLINFQRHLKPYSTSVTATITAASVDEFTPIKKGKF